MPDEAGVVEVEAGDIEIDVCDAPISGEDNVADEDLDMVVLFPDGPDEDLEAEWKALFGG